MDAVAQSILLFELETNETPTALQVPYLWKNF